MQTKGENKNKASEYLEDKLCPALTDEIFLLEDEKYALKPGSTIYNLGQQKNNCSSEASFKEVYIWLIDTEDQWTCERLYQCRNCGKIYLPMYFSLSEKLWKSRYSLQVVHSDYLKTSEVLALYRPIKRAIVKTMEYLKQGTNIWYSDTHEGVFHHNRNVLEKHYVKLGRPENPLLKTILKCPICNKWIVGRETIGQLYDVIGDYDLIYENGKIVKKITKGDFLVRTNHYCYKNKDHHLVDINANVEISMIDHSVSWLMVPAAYCPICKKYYILESVYQKLKKMGEPVCQVTEQLYSADGIPLSESEMSSESYLYSLGYNVKASNNMLSTDRQSLLLDIVEQEKMSREAICAHLNFLIRRNRNNPIFSEAIIKWTEDRDFLENHVFHGIETVEVSSLSLRSRRDR